MASEELPAAVAEAGVSDEVLELVQNAAFADRAERRGQRCPFTTSQKVIPIIDGAPARELMRRVPFHDISISGISFHWRKPPEFEEAIVILDNLPQVIYARVRVERCQVVCQSPRTFLVGCSFLQRMAQL
ncbi:MAG TPA: hypothetical protein VGN42_19930 [Pirellulales bacterium]|nr:hypothetical protein [Pirellulales bacterium]